MGKWLNYFLFFRISDTSAFSRSFFSKYSLTFVSSSSDDLSRLGDRSFFFDFLLLFLCFFNLCFFFLDFSDVTLSTSLPSCVGFLSASFLLAEFSVLSALRESFFETFTTSGSPLDTLLARFRLVFDAFEFSSLVERRVNDSFVITL